MVRQGGFYGVGRPNTRFTFFYPLYFLIMDSKNFIPDENLKEIRFESKRDIFCRLATSRVEKVSYALDILSKLSSRRADYTEEDIKNIKKFLQSELDKTLSAFTPANETAKNSFVLKA